MKTLEMLRNNLRAIFQWFATFQA